MELNCHSGERCRFSDKMQEGWFAFTGPATGVWCGYAFVCLSLLWSQSVFHFLPVWLIVFFIVFSIVVSLQKKNPKPTLILPFLFSIFFLPFFHILAFLPLLLHCHMNIIFYEICFSALLFLSQCFPFLFLIYFQALFSLFPLSTLIFNYLNFFSFCQFPHFVIISISS